MNSEVITPSQVRHVLRYAKATEWLEPNWRVIDMCCGNGYGTAIIYQKCKDVIGVDIDKEALTEAINRCPNARFVILNILDAFPAIRAEAVVFLEAIEHFKAEDGLGILVKINNATLPGGSLILSTPYCAYSGKSDVNLEHLHEYSLTELEMTLDKAGFRITAIDLQRHEGQGGRLGYCMVRALKK